MRKSVSFIICKEKYNDLMEESEFDKPYFSSFIFECHELMSICNFMCVCIFLKIIRLNIHLTFSALQIDMRK